MKADQPHEQQVQRRHMAEMTAVFFSYVIVQAASLRAASALPAGPHRTIVLLVPAVPALLMLGTVFRHFSRVDEYLRVRMLENIAITAAVLFGGTFIYGLLEIAGFPRPSMVILCPAMAAVSVSVSIFRRALGR